MNSSCGFPLSLTASSLATTNELEISQLDGFPTWCKVLRLSMKTKNFFAKLQNKMNLLHEGLTTLDTAETSKSFSATFLRAQSVLCAVKS